jgi:hypothetical protein
MLEHRWTGVRYLSVYLRVFFSRLYQSKGVSPAAVEDAFLLPESSDVYEVAGAASSLTQRAATLNPHHL